jgi:hypothetical protein
LNSNTNQNIKFKGDDMNIKKHGMEEGISEGLGEEEIIRSL